MATDDENNTTPNITPDTTPTAKKAAAKPAAKKPQSTRTTQAKSAAKSTPAKGIDVSKSATSKPSAPLKTGATRAATSNSGDDTDLKGRAANTVRTAANEGKSMAGEAIGSFGNMLENSAKTIDENLGEKYGNYARSAADSVSSFANKVNSKDVDEMVEDAREFVRKKPAIAIGAAAVVGLLVSRLIKSGMDDRA